MDDTDPSDRELLTVSHEARPPAVDPQAAATVPPAAARQPHPQFLLVVGAAIVAVASGLAWPSVAAVRDWLHPPRRMLGDDWDLFNAIRMQLVDIVWAGWVFAMGAAVGSFLNVVVHRLPAGRSVVVGRSACPECGTGIRPRDNVPILGWLLLGGRCRHCGTLIDARYPIAEAAVAGFCLALCYAELLSGGMTLPIRTPNYYAGLLWTVLYVKWDLVGIYLYHVAAIAILFTWALIAADRRRLPATHVAGVLLVMGVLPVAFPWLHPVPLVHPGTTVAGVALPPEQPAWLWRGLAVSIAGMCLGGMIGAAFSGLRQTGHGGPPEVGPPAGSCGAAPLPGVAAPSLPSAFALLGAVFGWQAAAAVAVMSLVLLIAARAWEVAVAHGRGVVTLDLIVLVASVVHLGLWRWIVTAWSAAVALLTRAA
jgi:prepilin signal peptidase PulO-like enzyme (type II secretory pathway)